MAASICKRHDGDPRAVYQNYLDELKKLMTEGVGRLPPVQTDLQPPPWLKAAGPVEISRIWEIEAYGHCFPLLEPKDNNRQP
ncbi:MAG TPA: hypothetical protein VMY42_08370 [Thermoguttaceae bacterium]|nr:hypothetical protein [Thermoguttaceae bacterium]